MKNKRIILLYFVLFLIFIFVYRTWVFSFHPLTHGDWGFFFNETAISSRLGYFSLWMSDYSMGRVLLDVAQAPSYFLYGVFSKFFGFSFGLTERLIHFFPILILTPISIFFLLKHIFKNQISIFIGIIVYSFNTYFLSLQTGHITLMVGFSLAPLILYFFIRNVSENKTIFSIIIGLLSCISIAYEPRSFYIISLVLLLYFIFNIKQYSTYKEFLISSLYASIPVVILFLVNFYWIFSFLKLSLLTSNEIFNRGLFGNNFWNNLYSFTLHHPWWTNSTITVFENNDIPFFFWFIPFFAFLGLFLNRKNKNILFFGLISLLGILLSKQVSEPFPHIYQWLFENFPGFNAFREASKFYFLVALGYSVLIGSFIEWLWINWNAKRWQVIGKYILTFFVAMIFLWNTKPIITGEIGSLFETRAIPNDYILLKDFIVDQNEYFRTLWVPEQSRWSFYSSQNLKIGLINITESTWNDLSPTQKKHKSTQESVSSFFSLNFSDHLLDISSIKYVIVPLQDIANDDDFFLHYGGREDVYIRNWYIDQLDALTWLERINIGAKELVVYENKNFRPHIYKTKEKETVYRNIPYKNIKHTFKNLTEYEVVLKNVSEPLFVNFSESYHPDWKLRVGNFHWWEVLWDKSYFLSEEYHSENDAKLSSFYIDPYIICKEYTCTNNADGSRDIELTLYFKPQSYFYTGLIVSGTTFVGCLGYISWYGMRKSKWFRKKGYE